MRIAISVVPGLRPGGGCSTELFGGVLTAAIFADKFLSSFCGSASAFCGTAEAIHEGECPWPLVSPRGDPATPHSTPRHSPGGADLKKLARTVGPDLVSIALCAACFFVMRSRDCAVGVGNDCPPVATVVETAIETVAAAIETGLGEEAP